MTTKNSKRIVVLASGGDAPGMNACLEAIFREGTRLGYNLLGAIGGYDGLVLERFIQLTPANATGIARETGCVLHTSRSEAFMTEEGLKKAINNLNKHRVSAVVILGGNGSLKGAYDRLDINGVPVIGIPSTIDNDVFFTQNSLGFSSACEESVRLVDNLTGTMQTSGMDHVVKMMGRHCSNLADFVGATVFADIIDTEDNRHTSTQVANIFAANRKAGKISSMMIKQEKKCQTPITEAVITLKFLEDLKDAGGQSNVRLTTLGHLQRGAPPSARDRWLGVNYGKKAIEQIEANQTGVAIGLVGDFFVAVPISKANSMNKKTK